MLIRKEYAIVVPFELIPNSTRSSWVSVPFEDCRGSSSTHSIGIPVFHHAKDTALSHELSFPSFVLASCSLFPTPMRRFRRVFSFVGSHEQLPCNRSICSRQVQVSENWHLPLTSDWVPESKALSRHLHSLCGVQLETSPGSWFVEIRNVFPVLSS